jgi:predicted nuclease of restriction endonuclease-like (RecB) superfamily
MKPIGYQEFLESLKVHVRSARLRAALSVNRELVVLYWKLGREILGRQKRAGWGANVIGHLAEDLRHEFPEMKGLSRRNLAYMRAFGEAYPDEAIVQQLAAQLPWFHHCVLLGKAAVKDRIWYMRQAVEHGWSRNVLIHQIEAGLHRRLGKAQTNFERTLPEAQSDLAGQLVKDPYTFDFLSLSPKIRERDLERGLLDQVQKFLLELGAGFSFVGRQVAMEVGGQDYNLDLLFYHLRLRCFVVIELKAGPFKPEHAGKMNFYLSAVDDQMRHAQDQPSLGIILCKSKNKIVAEYALRDARKPMGISSYRLAHDLPRRWKGKLPTTEELEQNLVPAASPSKI